MGYVDLMGQLESKIETLKVAEQEMNSAKQDYDEKTAAYGSAMNEVTAIRTELNKVLDSLMPNQGSVRQYS